MDNPSGTTVIASRTKRNAAWDIPLWVPLLLSWVLMAATFSPKDRSFTIIGDLDAIALLKVFVRFGCLVVLGGLILRFWHHPKRSPVLKYAVPFLAFAGLALCSTFWSPLKSVTLGQAGSLTIALLLTINIAIAWRSHADTSTILFSTVSALTSIALFLLLLRFAAPDVGSLTRDCDGMLHATNAASMSSLALVLLIASRLLWGWHWSRRLLVPGIIINCSVLLLATNRVSLALTSVLLLVLFVCFANRGLVYATLLLASVACTGYLAVDPHFNGLGAVTSALSQYAQRGQSTTQLIADFSGRIEMWEKIWAAYQYSPIVGHGYFVCSPAGKLTVWYQTGNWTAHNVVLQCLMSTGIVGLVIFSLGLMRIGGRWLYDFCVGNISGATTFLVCLVGLWYLVWGMFNASFLGPVSADSITFFILLGLAVGHLAACQVDVTARPVVRLPAVSPDNSGLQVKF